MRGAVRGRMASMGTKMLRVNPDFTFEGGSGRGAWAQKNNTFSPPMRTLACHS